MINPRLKAYPAPVAADEDVSAGTSHWFMLQMVGTGKRVLEFGCASGYMSARLKEAGCHVTGVDVDVEALEAARAICDEVIDADLDLQPLARIVPDVAYDVLVFGDILEHLRDPWRVLDDSRRFVAPGGYAVLSIPNVAHGSVRLKLLQGNFDYSELGILDDTHLRFFTLKTVEELCLRSGYRIEAIERTKVPLFAETPLTPASREMMFDPELIDQIRRDPEHDTLQFVLRVTPLDDAQKFETLAKELASARDRLRDVETTARLSQEAYEEVEAELDARERGSRMSGGSEIPVLAVPAVEDGDTRRSSNGRGRGKTISARAIKRAEAFAADNERVRAELAAVSAARIDLAEELTAVLALNDALRDDLEGERRRRRDLEADGKELQNANAVLQRELESVAKERSRAAGLLRAAQDKLADVKLEHASCGEREAENAKFRETMTAAVRRFLHYAQSELASVQARTAEIDAAIVAVQGSKLWLIKRALGKLRR